MARPGQRAEYRVPMLAAAMTMTRHDAGYWHRCRRSGATDKAVCELTTLRPNGEVRFPPYTGGNSSRRAERRGNRGNRASGNLETGQFVSLRICVPAWRLYAKVGQPDPEIPRSTRPPCPCARSPSPGPPPRRAGQCQPLEERAIWRKTRHTRGKENRRVRASLSRSGYQILQAAPAS
jgi:hypothetical protein